MQENYLIIAIALVIIIILISLLFIITNLQKTVIIRQVEREKEIEAAKSKTIEEMVEIAAYRGSSRNDLTVAILEVAKSCIFPIKIKGVAPKSAKTYLNFVLLIASHKNADAKLIAFMNTELKKANPEYKTEIDIYESEGIHQRGNRI
ncbi:MAG: hypothetical protein PHN18_07315 [Sulfurospirillaceae bacterium]|jgi:hypothetical protein|nr:hypothetical protein [Sulfurospirillaceae bacterium]MDD2827205.1 hypothetical protein [Sulfurospirillaceae bacterium]